MVREQALLVLRRLEAEGYEAYFVGGCVRDWLLGRPVQDIDICTNAHPGDVMRLFPDHVPTGLKHGTVSVRQGGFLFEVTTYRTEGVYLDYRRPAEVTFVSDLRTDLERRDFTINAMAMNRLGDVVDPFGGRDDLQRRVIRAVGVAEVRFSEDALRLLRGVRFAAQLGFSIEEGTLTAMRQTAPLLGRIAVERVREELHKLLLSPYPDAGASLIMQTDLLVAMPPLAHLFRRGAEKIGLITRLEGLVKRWTLLFYAAACVPKQVREICQGLRMSNQETDEISRLTEMLHQLVPQWGVPHEVEWKPLLLQYGQPFCRQAAHLLSAIWEMNADSQLEKLDRLYAELPVKTMRELAITGKDLQTEIAKRPGPWIHHTLQHLLVKAALGGLPNERECLVDEARKEVARYEKHQTGNSEGVL